MKILLEQGEKKPESCQHCEFCTTVRCLAIGMKFGCMLNYENCPITEQGDKTPEEINRETNEIIEKIMSETKNGNIVLMTVEGLVVVKLEDFIKQPADGILYDLNKNESVALTFLRNQEIRGINDYATALTIRMLKSKLEDNK